jgi:hypothetical protein
MLVAARGMHQPNGVTNGVTPLATPHHQPNGVPNGVTLGRTSHHWIIPYLQVFRVSTSPMV